MTPKQAVALVRSHGVLLESERGPVSNLAETIAGEPIRGSWWGHPKSHAIFTCSRVIRESPNVLVCRLMNGKVTYIHRQLWPALVRLAPRLRAERLAAVRDIHTASGKHQVETTPFPEWVPEETLRAAEGLTDARAEQQLSVLLSTIPGDAM